MKMRLLSAALSFAVFMFTFGLSVAAEDAKRPAEKPVYVFAGREGVTPFGNDEATIKIFKMGALLDEGKDLVRRGLFGEAIAKYKEAMHPSLLNRDSDVTLPRGYVIRTYTKIGRYEEALELAKVQLQVYPENPYFQDSKRELEALIKARDTGSNEPIYEHIAYLKKRYKRYLPPKGYDTIHTTPIIRLYDHIGDMDGGIAFVDEVIAYYAERWGVKPEEIGSKNQYFQIKQAFLEDKKHGKKGRATQALIESDYFPW